jgi:hypothetical protein
MTKQPEVASSATVARAFCCDTRARLGPRGERISGRGQPYRRRPADKWPLHCFRGHPLVTLVLLRLNVCKRDNGVGALARSPGLRTGEIDTPRG